MRYSKRFRYKLSVTPALLDIVGIVVNKSKWVPLTTIDKELILLPFTSQGYRHRFAQLVRFGMGCLTTWRLCDCTVIVRSYPRMAAAMRVHIVAWIIFYFIFNYLFLLIIAIDTDRRVVSSGKRSCVLNGRRDPANNSNRSDHDEKKF